jgi:N-acetylglucosamine transport system permease protein
MRQGQIRFIIGFLALPMMLYAVFCLGPYLQGFQISLTDWRGYSADYSYVGFDNYIRLAQDSRWWGALAHNAIILIIMPVAVLVLALIFAFMINVGGQRIGAVTGVRGSTFYSILYFFPHILPSVMILLLWQFVFNPRIGLLNGTLEALGLDRLTRAWLGDPDTALWAVLGVMVWGAVGFFVVLFTAAMQSIPKDFYEAAYLDGASRLRIFRNVTFPLIFENVKVGYVYLGMGALDMFAAVAILTPGGGPDGSTEVIATYLYHTAFASGQFGYASAMGVAMAMITLLFAALSFRLSRRERLEF